ncbi:putative sugar transferase EpsL [Roseimaritima multifibrata]|uniref:Putative sugar transferase EpsL n=1 Tax=Roseimaritima multifibrata TaxID=1930274 RepID=A0A517ML38_9BACT|nr:sugar transferase [Roseimaritima multifibrata]QDS95601.1 putative sugar transferase EpsL [Roseimaritima multifibrata]
MSLLLDQISSRWRGASSCHRSLLTRRQLERELTRERMRTARHQSPFCLLTIELLKPTCSKKNLRSAAKLLFRSVRKTDLKGELAPRTLGVLLVDTSEMGGRIAIDRLRTLFLNAGLNIKVGLQVFDPSGFQRYDQPSTPQKPPANHLPGSSDSLNDKDKNGDNHDHQPPEPVTAFTTSTNRATKRAFDIAGASCGLLLAAPLIAGMALSIRLTSKGPAFFRQLREGQNGKPFTIYKMRTMVVNAESQQPFLESQNDRNGPAFKMANDPRVTPLGDILRRLCLDELPQLWNVLRGDMSLVGPRPLPLSESRACTPWQRRRLDIRPGLTGVWQVNKRQAKNFDEWMRLDLGYVDNRSMIKDVTLLAKTVTVPLSGRGSE